MSEDPSGSSGFPQHPPRGKAQLDTIQFHLVHKALIGDGVILVSLGAHNGKQVVSSEHRGAALGHPRNLWGVKASKILSRGGSTESPLPPQDSGNFASFPSNHQAQSQGTREEPSLSKLLREAQHRDAGHPPTQTSGRGSQIPSPSSCPLSWLSSYSASKISFKTQFLQESR